MEKAAVTLYSKSGKESSRAWRRRIKRCYRRGRWQEGAENGAVNFLWDRSAKKRY